MTGGPEVGGAARAIVIGVVEGGEEALGIVICERMSDSQMKGSRGCGVGVLARSLLCMVGGTVLEDVVF